MQLTSIACSLSLAALIHAAPSQREERNVVALANSTTVVDIPTSQTATSLIVFDPSSSAVQAMSTSNSPLPALASSTTSSADMANRVAASASSSGSSTLSAGAVQSSGSAQAVYGNDGLLMARLAVAGAVSVGLGYWLV